MNNANTLPAGEQVDQVDAVALNAELDRAGKELEQQLAAELQKMTAGQGQEELAVVGSAVDEDKDAQMAAAMEGSIA